MTTFDILSDSFSRVRGVVHSVLRDATEKELTYRADPDANTIAWLVWHLTRGQDVQVLAAAGEEQEWIAGGWSERFQLPFDDGETGYGQSTDEVGSIPGSADLLKGYHDAVHDRTIAYLSTLTDADLEEIVDRNWNPPVTRAVRLVSVLADDLQHCGQAAYVRGLARRAG